MEKEIFLALGCGKRNYGGKWTHIDGEKFDHIDSHDIVNLPYEDDSVSIIYASHVLEYFDREEVKDVLEEWYKVLKPNGKIYLSVPDFRAMTSLYYIDDIPLHRFLGPLYGKMDMGNKTIYHKTVYDYSSLGDLLRFIGFKKIETWNHFEWDFLADVSEDCDFDDHSKAKVHGESICLNLVARK